MALLAVLKVNAAYVPLDAGFPKDRIGFILNDAGVKADRLAVGVSRRSSTTSPVTQIFLDAADARDRREADRATDRRRESAADRSARLHHLHLGHHRQAQGRGDRARRASAISSGWRPRCTASRPDDRFYQGMTIAFDFSVEELWVPLIAGATLVPGKAGHEPGRQRPRRLSPGAAASRRCAACRRCWRRSNRICRSCASCSCRARPARTTSWCAGIVPGRIILNAYGPTEATVTATMTELDPDKPVTIGGPLPTYTIVILDRDKDAALPTGRPRRDRHRRHRARGRAISTGTTSPRRSSSRISSNIPNNPSKRIYRTGDLGRINEQDEVEFHGRIDTQVKIRGYRIELAEIESVLVQLPQIAQAVVDTYEAEPGSVELVAYYTPASRRGRAVAERDRGRAAQASAALHGARLYRGARRHPDDDQPQGGSQEPCRAPKGPRVAARAKNFVAPQTETEKILASALDRGA